MPLPAFLAGDVTQRDGDQYRDGDPHSNADPHDLFVNTTVAFPWKHAGFILYPTPCTGILSAGREGGQVWYVNYLRITIEKLDRNR